MLGQGTITINNATWPVSLAADPVDMAQGLGGLASLPAGTGELFDLDSLQTIQVTTVPMLFNLDIAMLDSNLTVTEIYRNVEPGYIVASQQPAQYFLEVNAGELADINIGEQAAEVITVPPVIASAAGSSGWTGILDACMPLIMLVAMMGMMIPLMKSLLPGETHRPQLLGDTRIKAGGKFRIKNDRMGDIIITHNERPGRDVFLQMESDREMVYDLLKGAEKRDLEAGWPIEIPDQEPRASILNEIWETASSSNANTRFPPKKEYTVWVRLGNQGDRLAYEIPYQAGRLVGRHLANYPNPKSSCRYLSAGVEIAPYYLHQNQISLYWGDEEAQLVRDLNGAEKSEFERGINDTLRNYLIASAHPKDEGKRDGSKKGPGGLDYLPDDQEFMAYTIEDIGYRDKIDSAFLEAIRRAKGAN